MIVDNLKNISKYNRIISDKVSEFLKSLSPSTKAGHYEIDENSYANVDEYSPKSLDNCKFEAHKKYIDIQMLLEGEEEIDCINVEVLEISEEYNAEKDVMFFKNSSKTPDKIILTPGKFIFIYPHEAHKPQIKTTSDKVKKVVVKIAV